MSRQATIQRKTQETQIDVTLNIEGSGKSDIDTGVGFLDHMLEQLAFHGLLDLEVKCKGDLHIDSHHSVEDIGIALGQAFRQALGKKLSIQRYAHAYVPMDEALLRVVLDISGRPEFHFDGEFSLPYLGQLDTQMISHFFKSFAFHSQITLHMSILYGFNDHHKCEGLFKAFARSLRDAASVDPRRKQIASTKGSL